MAATTSAPTTALRVQARPAGFFVDVASVARRAIRQIPREPEAVIPALIVPVFFYVLNIGALSKITHEVGHFSFKSFELPVAVVFAVTGVSRASALVTDIQNGYFDRLMITPVRRLPLLLGLMTADLTLVMALAIPVVLLGLALGVRFHAGVLGIVVFVVLSGIWGLVFTGLPYAIALKTGNPGAVNASFILFFPITFLSTTFVAKQFLQGWLGTVATYNPMTYILQGLRSLIVGGGGGSGPRADLERGLPRPSSAGHRGVRSDLVVARLVGATGAGPPLLSTEAPASSDVEFLEEHGVLGARRHASVARDVAQELVGIEIGPEAVDVRLVLSKRRHTVVDGGRDIDEVGGG